MHLHKPDLVRTQSPAERHMNPIDVTLHMLHKVRMGEV